jgi:hypothetical protein
MDCREYLAVNLFAFRSTNPKGLKTVSDPIGPENDEYLLAAVDWADEIVIAWGAGGAARGPLVDQRAKAVLELLKSHRLWCLGYTKGNQPRFPLYLRADTIFEAFQWPYL